MKMPRNVVELVEGMENLCIMDAVDGLQKVTEIDGLEGMSSALMVSSGGLNKRGRGCPPLLVGSEIVVPRSEWRYTYAAMSVRIARSQGSQLPVKEA